MDRRTRPRVLNVIAKGNRGGAASTKVDADNRPQVTVRATSSGTITLKQTTMLLR
jgi:hypothetical protein